MAGRNRYAKKKAGKRDGNHGDYKNCLYFRDVCQSRDRESGGMLWEV